jgi:hypothetical protein
MAKVIEDRDDIILQCQKRFRRCEVWEDTFRKLFREDLKFSNGDSDNGYQWPDAQRKTRDVDAKPCLTINKTFQHNLLIINDIVQNMPVPTIKAAGDEGSAEAADVLKQWLRHVGYRSNAEGVFKCAAENQVQGGIGYWRVVADYVDDKTFDQEILYKPIRDSLKVMIDCDAQQFDKSDANYAFVFSDFENDAFNNKYGIKVDELSNTGIGDGDTWIQNNNVRVCEYYVREFSTDELWAVPDSKDATQYHTILKSQMPESMRAEAQKRPGFKSRTVRTPKVMWYLIAGKQVIDEKEIKSDYIPIACAIGWENVIDGKLERKGHTRQLKDPQRMYNFWASSAVEHVALQGKQPYITDLRAVEGLEPYWRDANKENFAYLPYNGVDDDGNPIEKPERQQPPVMAQGYIQGLQNAANEMAMVSGQYQTQFGAPGPEEAGVAIQARRRQGGISTYHFSANFALAVQHCARIALSMFPHYYDTRRVIDIMADDGSISQIVIDPTQQHQAVVKKQVDAKIAQMIFNPRIGRYEVQASTGPNYQTRREEAFEAFRQIITGNPELMKICGDLVFRAADFPMAEEIAERLRRAIPQEILTGQPNPQVVALQQQVQQLEQMLQMAKRAVDEKAAKIDVEEYRAQTDRLHTLIDHPGMDPREIRALIQKEVAEMLNGLLPLQPIAPNGGNPSPPNGAQPPQPGQAVPNNPPQGQVQ